MTVRILAASAAVVLASAGSALASSPIVVPEPAPGDLTGAGAYLVGYANQTERLYDNQDEAVRRWWNARTPRAELPRERSMRTQARKYNRLYLALQRDTVLWPEPCRDRIVAQQRQAWRAMVNRASAYRGSWRPSNIARRENIVGYRQGQTESVIVSTIVCLGANGWVPTGPQSPQV